MQPALPFRFQSEHTALSGSCDFLPEANSAHRGRNENWTSSPRAEKTKKALGCSTAPFNDKKACVPKASPFLLLRESFERLLWAFNKKNESAVAQTPSQLARI